MLTSTFCHIPGIGTTTEYRLWDAGFHCWDDIIRSDSIRLSPARLRSARYFIEQSIGHLEDNNPRYFANLLPSSLLWRLFSEFRNSTAYVDIETTGLDGWSNYITTIALYDGRTVSCYVHDRNLDDFKKDIENYQVIITYNGRCFDIPFIREHLAIPLHHVHIDLRYLLKSLGYAGGLKGCEKQLGLDRKELSGMDGYFAVLLWDDFIRHGNVKALETLLAYNVEDAVNLETLMVMAYNMKLKNTPFAQTHELPLPEPPEIPFHADLKTIDRIRTQAWRLY